MKSERSKISVLDGRYLVSTIGFFPVNQKAVVVLGHGAGAGMEHRFMEQLARNLATNDIGTIRYNFPYIEQGRKSPTSPAISEATVRAVVGSASIAKDIPLFVAGKSYGGRMSSQAQAKEPMPGVSGLIFYGFPLHPPGRPANIRGEHLQSIKIPLLFLQGSRDKLADLQLLTPLVKEIGSHATMEILEGADHSFNMLKSAELSSEQVQQKLADLTSLWIDKLIISDK